MNAIFDEIFSAVGRSATLEQALAMHEAVCELHKEVGKSLAAARRLLRDVRELDPEQKTAFAEAAVIRAMRDGEREVIRLTRIAVDEVEAIGLIEVAAALREPATELAAIAEVRDAELRAV